MLSTVSTLFCPRCREPLEACGGGSSIHRCTSCDGALVAQSALQSLLEALAEDLKNEECLNDVILQIPDKGARVNCPQCGSPMENYGYLSSDKVQIDGCSNCSVVWTDTDELGVMAALHARTMTAHDEVQLKRAIDDLEAAHFRALRRIRRSFRGIRF